MKLSIHHVLIAIHEDDEAFAIIAPSFEGCLEVMEEHILWAFIAILIPKVMAVLSYDCGLSMFH